MEFVDGWGRTAIKAAARCILVEASLLIQQLSLDVLDRGRQVGVVLANRGDLRVDLLAEIAHHLDHLVDGLFEDCLGDWLLFVFSHGCGEGGGAG